MIPVISVIKTHASHPLDRDRAVEMRSSPFHHDRYNSSFKACALIVIGGPCVHTIDARISSAPLIRRTASGHVTCIKNNSVELSPTWRKLKEGIGFITCNELEE